MKMLMWYDSTCDCHAIKTDKFKLQSTGHVKAFNNGSGSISKSKL